MRHRAAKALSLRLPVVAAGWLGGTICVSNAWGITPDAWQAPVAADYYSANWENINFIGNPAPPAQGDYLWVNNGSSVTHSAAPSEVITLSTTSPAGQYLEISSGSLSIMESGNSGGAGYGLSLNTGGYLESDGSGTINIAGPLTIGDGSGTSGALAQFWNGTTVNIGTTVGTNQSTVIGNGGSGEIDQIGAAFTSPNINIGNTGNGGSGVYFLYSGTLSATNSVTLGNSPSNELQVLGGTLTTPSLTQNGGNVLLGGGDSTLTTLQITGGTFAVGYSSSTAPLPNFYSGGTYFVDSIARTPSPVTATVGTLNISGGTFALNGAASVTATSTTVPGGSFAESAGTFTTNSADFSGATGFSFTGGTMTINGSTFKPHLQSVFWNNGSGNTLFATNSWQISGNPGGPTPSLFLQNSARSTTGTALVVGNSGGSGVVAVNGTDTTLSSPGGITLAIGIGGSNTGGIFIPGTGALNLSGRTRVFSSITDVGLSGGQGTISIDGITSQLNTNQLLVGEGVFSPPGLQPIGGSGTLKITNKGQAIASTLHIGFDGAQGKVSVDGANSNLTTTSELIVGQNGTTNVGTLIASNFGSINSSGSATIGGSGGIGLVTINGQNTSWTNSGTINVGDFTLGTGTGTLTVGSGGIVTTDGLAISQNAGSVVNLGNGGAINTGTLSTFGNPQDFNWTGGALSVTNSQVTVSSVGTLESNVTLKSNQTLAALGGLAVAGGSALRVSGASITTPSLQNSGAINETSGSIVAGNTSNDGTIQQTGGSANLGTIVGAGSISVGNPSGNVVTMNVNSITQSNVLIDSTGLLVVGGGPGTGNTVNSLQINNGGLLNLGNASLTINYGNNTSPDSTIRAYIASAYNAGGTLWTGSTGITSSNAAADPAHHTVAFADGADGMVINLPANVSSAIPSGGILPAGDELVTYAFAGDANLDGQVDFSDFVILSNHFGSNSTSWDQGNFNYDSMVDFSDFVILSNNFGLGVQGNGTGATSAQLARYNSFAAGFGISNSQIAAWDARISSLPEPGSTILVGLGAIGLLHRRKRTAR
ncbi:MAG: PEP-CTERM sorting domain-containing protein [Planctomycetota bacterium]|nr:PEP-CTERM sorting domain-containing protein [Planctomycetota bacterium]